MDKRKNGSIEMVIIDGNRDQIHCVIKSQYVSMFDRSLMEGITFKVEANSRKFAIAKRQKPVKLIEVELDNLRGNGKFCCSLWEEFARQLLSHLANKPASEYIVILQLGKMKAFNGTMSISNTNYASRLFINADYPEVKSFRQRLLGFGSKICTVVAQLEPQPAYSMEEDFLRITPYMSISNLKEIVECSTYVTYGSVVEVEPRAKWWYKACRKFFHSLDVNVKIENLNIFQPSAISISRLCFDDAVVMAFKDKYCLHDVEIGVCDDAGSDTSLAEHADLGDERYGQQTTTQSTRPENNRSLESGITQSLEKLSTSDSSRLLRKLSKLEPVPEKSDNIRNENPQPMDS
ncbi:hypothetical protein PIB30_044547 [Stylosanthes scabra]|uniref:Uncharacterized protein n=1 Tax=Stylosanthes scabra TaxID=79078 RepID=A0ABU6TFM6_9FABA|nr:hypothetical protein [Stylosanthes scabra]